MVLHGAQLPLSTGSRQTRAVYRGPVAQYTGVLRELAASFCVTLPFDRANAQASLLPPPPSLDGILLNPCAFPAMAAKVLPFAYKSLSPHFHATCSSSQILVIHSIIPCALKQSGEIKRKRRGGQMEDPQENSDGLSIIDVWAICGGDKKKRSKL